MQAHKPAVAGIYPKSKTELFIEYHDRISIGTFRKWLMELSEEGKIRKGVKVLNVREVQAVYTELGAPGSSQLHFPKSKSELFHEYKDQISIGTFRKWIKGLTEEGKIRRGKKVLNVKEVQIVYEELGIPGDLAD